MRIAIIGAGNVGGGLGAALATAGHEVVFGVRDPDGDTARGAVAAAPGARATSPAGAIGGAEVIVVAIRPDAIAEVVGGLPPLDGRVVIDAMNRFGGDPGRSTTQDLADLLPGARVVKAFNTAGNATFVNPRYDGGPPDMFICGNDDEAKSAVSDICKRFGWGTVDLGGIDASHYLEAMCLVWVLHGARSGTWGHAFKLLR
jgi:predicted dinucleotide-binding enzyme